VRSFDKIVFIIKIIAHLCKFNVDAMSSVKQEDSYHSVLTVDTRHVRTISIIFHLQCIVSKE